MFSVGVDPVSVLRHLDVNPGDVRGTPDAPGDDSSQDVVVVLI